jgi:putative membrane protein
VLGILIFIGAFALVDKITPYDLWGEICENKNTALAIIVGAMSIGMCIIIAAAVH